MSKPLTYVPLRNRGLEEWVNEEGLDGLCDCVREVSSALNTGFTLADVLMTDNSMLQLLVFCAWMKRVGSN